MPPVMAMTPVMTMTLVYCPLLSTGHAATDRNRKVGTGKLGVL